jgi:hypothetical protein
MLEYWIAGYKLQVAWCEIAVFFCAVLFADITPLLQTQSGGQANWLTG